MDNILLTQSWIMMARLGLTSGKDCFRDAVFTSLPVITQIRPFIGNYFAIHQSIYRYCSMKTLCNHQHHLRSCWIYLYAHFCFWTVYFLSLYRCIIPSKLYYVCHSWLMTFMWHGQVHNIYGYTDWHTNISLGVPTICDIGDCREPIYLTKDSLFFSISACSSLLLKN